jgi:hypothetical protein
VGAPPKGGHHTERLPQPLLALSGSAQGIAGGQRASVQGGHDRGHLSGLDGLLDGPHGFALRADFRRCSAGPEGNGEANEGDKTGNDAHGVLLPELWLC